ncbi:hypothetical protein EPJ66_11655 [Brachyspira aalborgi]|uniref:hypothetical protein n=1 Tax=Brachyspira aalborgi TaxID=29522 RepID=UPI0011C9EC2C|nr:hypothetical protein [Brachyspira aalborgi]TXJ49589.1 hypothetical protein EPJ66_11655 [Brachyspira aalborgi]
MPYQLINILDKRKYKLLCSDMYDSDIFKMIPFNSIELELLKRYYCNKYMSTIQYANRQNINRIYNRANIYQDVLLRIEEGKAYLRIKKFGIFFNFEPNLFQIFQSLILKCYLFLVSSESKKC